MVKSPRPGMPAVIAQSKLLANYAFKEAAMKSAVAIGILIITALLLSGCNTIRGAGEDIEQGGQAIQRSAE